MRYKNSKILLFSIYIFFFIYFGIYCNNSYALTFKISKNSDIVGNIQTTTFKQDDTLQTIARKFDIAITELLEANQKINPKNIKVGTKLIIPTQFILPPGPKEGIVLNLAEFRIYYFSKDQKTVSTFPVGIGKLGSKTPIGETTIVNKREKPTWIPPQSIRDHYENKGKILPAFIPPGPNNPLGEYAINLAWPSYLIHGTNVPSSIGLRSSSGCIRMFPEDIEELFNLVDLGTTVRIIHEPFKVGKKKNELYLEAHKAFKEKYYNNDDNEEELLEKVINEYYQHYQQRVNWTYVNQALQQSVGYPVDITKPPIIEK